MKFFNRPELKEKRKELRKSIPKAEQMLWYRIKVKRFLNTKFRRQQSIGPYIVDFYCSELKFAIEIDGDSHFSEDGIKHDNKRTGYLVSEGIDIIRFTNTEVYLNIEQVLNELKLYIESAQEANRLK